MLERVRFGRTGLMVTKLAFGGIPIQRLSRQDGIQLVKDALELGINFIDTAHGYGHSEELIGEAIQTVPRESVVIATKSPATDRKTLLADLDESLRRLRTDHVDIFQLHNVASKEKMAAVMGPHGAFEGMKEAIRAGKIRFAAFSTHSLPIATEMIRTGCFDAVQIPFNFLDCQAAEEVIPARSKGRHGHHRNETPGRRPPGRCAPLLSIPAAVSRRRTRFRASRPCRSCAKSLTLWNRPARLLRKKSGASSSIGSVSERVVPSLRLLSTMSPAHSHQHRSDCKELRPKDAQAKSAVICRGGLQGGGKLRGMP